MRKNYFFMLWVVTLFTTSLFAQGSKVSMFSDIPENQVPFMYVSPNGQYACGYSQGFAILYSAATNTCEYLGESYVANYMFCGVNDKGDAIGSFCEGGDITACRPILYKNGEKQELPLPDGYPFGSATGISADGTIIVGWAQKGFAHKPCVWKNGELTNILKFPEKDPYGAKTEQGATAFGISADGKVIIGRYIMHQGELTLAIWTDLDKECTLPCLDMQFNMDDPITMEYPNESDYITVGYVEGGDNTLYYEQIKAWEKVYVAWNEALRAFEKDFIFDARASVISPNGKYMGTTSKDGKVGYIEIESGKYNPIDKTGLLLTITDKADACIATPYFDYARNSYLYFNESDTSILVQDYIKDKYDFDILNDVENGITSVSGHTVSGSVVMSDDCKVFYTYVGAPNAPFYNFRIGLDENQSVEKMKVGNMAYVNGQLFVGEESADIEICNLSGTVIYQAKQVTSVCPELPAGIYIVKAFKAEGQLMMKIAVK